MTDGAAVGVLVVTHGPAGAAMLESLRELVGEAAGEGFEALTVPPGEPRDRTASRVEEAARRLDGGAGVLVVTDLFGATPTNCAVELKRAGVAIEVLSGVNLAMLVKLATARRPGRTAARLAHEAAETAIRAIRLAEGGPA